MRNTSDIVVYRFVYFKLVKKYTTRDDTCMFTSEYVSDRCPRDMQICTKILYIELFYTLHFFEGLSLRAAINKNII